MKIEKPEAAILELFERHVPGAPGVECRNMFGARAAFVNGNMFMGTFEQDLVLRLPPGMRERLLGLGGEPFAPLGRTMREYVIAPGDMHDDDDALEEWVGRSLMFAASLPPKVKKPKAPPRKKGSSSD
jgi:TfoX/Sxy family transcriptional regulator of competence genes